MKLPLMYFVFTFAGIGFSALLTKAVIEFLVNDDFWFLIILFLGAGLFIVGVWPIRKKLLELLK